MIFRHSADDKVYLLWSQIMQQDREPCKTNVILELVLLYIGQYKTSLWLLCFFFMQGGVSEEKVDSFNIPMYCMSPQELEAAVERNGSFSIESMENLPHVSVDDTVSKSQLFAAHMRAGMEGLVKQKFGEEILDELFDLFRKKLEEAPFFFETGKTISFLCVLRRKGNGFEHAV